MFSSIWQFINQHTPLFYLIQPIWRDEAFSILIAKSSPAYIIQATSADFTPPLFYLLLHYWILLFGSSEIATRLLSFIFHIGTAITVYPLTHFFCKKFNLKNKHLPLFASILTILNPMLLYYAFEVRAYSLLATFVTLSFYAFVTHRKYLYIAVVSLGLYTHYYFALAYLSQIIYLAIVSHGIKDLKKYLYITTPVLMFSPWIPYLWNQLKNTNESWYYSTGTKTWLTSLGSLFTNYQGNPESYINPLILFTFIMLSISLYIAKKIKTAHLLTIWLIFPPITLLTVSEFKPIWVNRYLLYTAVCQSIIITLFIGHLHKKMQIMVFFLCALGLLWFNLSFIKYQKKMDYRTPLKELKLKLKPQDLIAVTDSLALFETRYYLMDNQNEIKLFLPTNTHLPNYVGTAIIDKKDIIHSLPLDKTVYLLNLDGSIILNKQQ